MALKVTKAVIEKQAALLSGGSGNLEQSGNSTNWKIYSITR